MRTIVTYKHVLDCISRSKHFELPCLLPDLKNFPPQEWHDCIRRVQQADSPSPENDESLRLLLNWGAENNWFQLLEQATAHVGEDTRFETDGWMKMVDEENREVCNGEKNMLSVSQHKYSSKYPNRELWCENSGYNVAAALFEEHPELSVKVVSGTKRSIYHSAAQKNASAILILAADVAQDNRLDNHDAINSRDGAKRTPLAWAVLYSHPRVVRTLFHIFPDLRVTESDLLQAINSQQKDIVTPLSEHRPRLININMVRRAMKVPDVKIPDFNIWKTLVRVLIKARPRADQKQSDEQFMEGTDLLHYAVQGRRLEMVQDLVKRFPTLTVQLPNGGHTVLWYNTSKNGEPRTAIQDEIRQLIVPVVIGLKSSVEDIRTFIGDDGKRKEVELDLNPGKAPPQAVSRFIQKICDLGSPDTAQEDRSVLAELEFESTLRYVDFPIFEMTKNNGSHMNDHDLRYGTKANHSRSDDIGFRDEAHSVLKWLRDRKGVRKIIEVRVADSQYHPHSEQVIEESLERFDVEILNWKRADLSVDSISIAAPNVKKLYLYSNGSKASIGHWAGSDGVGRLEKLEEIHVTFWTDHISRQQAASYGERAKAKLEGLRTKNGYSWSVTIEPPRKFCESGDPGDPRVDAPKLARVKPAKAVKIVDFLDGYQNLSRDILEYPTRYPELTGQLYPRIRVAVIDTGVDETLLDDTFRGISGQSFVVEEGKESMWWIAKELHGTRMAHIIHSLDPFCKLKIYKCGDARTDITKERVTRAIRKGIEDNVDIISMSFCFKQSDSDLKEAIGEAVGKDIVIFASTDDDGNNAAEAWPAQCEGVMRIVAFTSKGKPIKEAAPIHGDDTFGLQGEGIDLTIRGDGSDDENVRGSSVATAMAAGIASLILACRRLTLSMYRTASFSGDRPFSGHRREAIREVMGRMTEPGRETKYVKPWTVFTAFLGEAEEVQDHIKELFKNFSSVESSIPIGYMETD